MKEAIVIHSQIIGLGVVRALGQMGIPVIAMYYDGKEEIARFSKYVKKGIRVPHPNRYEDEFVALLMDKKLNLAGRLLIPCDDYSLVCLSKHKEELQSKYTVAAAEWPVVQKIIEKPHTYAIAERLNIPFPRTIVPAALSEVEALHSEIEFPCLVKPTESHKFYDRFKTKMFLAKNWTELEEKYQLATENGFEVMITEYIPGDDRHGVNYNSYFIAGTPVAEFTARKVRLDPPQFGRPRVVMSAAVPEVVVWGRLLLRELSFDGYSCMEFKMDARDGVHKLMEINGRSNLSTSLAVKCGINFPWIQYNHLLNGCIPESAQQKQNIYWIELLKDTMHFFISKDKEDVSLKEYFRPYLKPNVFAIVSTSDPLPFIARVVFIFLHFIDVIYQTWKSLPGRFRGSRRKARTPLSSKTERTGITMLHAKELN